MVGAIEFLKAWNELCWKRKDCEGCVIDKECGKILLCQPDEEIASIVRKVMAWKAQEEQNK